MIKNIKIFSLLLIVSFAFNMCSQTGRDTEKKLANDSKKKVEAIKQDFNKAKQMFYALPSPIETAMLIKQSGVKYNPELLNPIENKKKYVSTYSLALNLGIYSANLSYASMFEQSQTSIKYMATAKEIAESLGILKAIDKSIVDRLENNINNRDSIMDIISESFSNSDVFLKENGRPEIAALLIAGGWIEGLYLATEFSLKNPDNEDIKDRIADQKLSLETLIKLLESHKDNTNVKRVLHDLGLFKVYYDKFDMVSSDIKTVTNASQSQTFLKAKSDIFHDDDIIKGLAHVVDSVRNAIVNAN